MISRDRLAGALALLAVTAIPSRASAGGFELPDNGTQALGRGATFVAKADDPSAIYHNVAGIARQRGTRLLVNTNVLLHATEFQRAGTYPDDPNDPNTPWGGQPFPTVRNAGGPFAAPFLALTSDFGYFDRLTAGLAVFGPSAVGNRTFPLGIERKPSPSRYDAVQSRSLLLYPTAAAAFRVTPWLDVGLAGHLVVAKFDQTTISSADLNRETCKNVEYQPCDARGELQASATSFAAGIGVMVRPSESMQFGASVRTPTTINAIGTISSRPPAATPTIEVKPGPASLALQLPYVVKVGGRYIKMDRTFELYDLELDVTYEGWGSAQRTGPIVRIPELGPYKDIETLVVHGYKNTYSIRLGGAYNMEQFDGVLSLRGGAYYDSTATAPQFTRLDFDTLAKVAGTLGVGYRRGAFGVDFAYAAVASVPRLVTQGEVRPVNGTKQGDSVDANGQDFAPVNEGSYRGFTHIISIGVTVTFDELLGGKRKVEYGNDYEEGYGGPGAAPPKKATPKLLQKLIPMLAVTVQPPG